MNKKNITEELVKDALLILASIEFIGLEFEKVIVKLDKIEKESEKKTCDDMVAELENLNKQLNLLRRKLDIEDKNIIDFYKKYEKKAILSNSAKIEQAPDGCISPHKNRKNRSRKIQKRLK